MEIQILALLLALIVVFSFGFFYFNERSRRKYNVYVKRLHIYHFFANIVILIFVAISGDEEDILRSLIIANLFFAICFRLYVAAKKTDAVKPPSNELKEVPDVCPQCKNSNTQKSSTCEWCGNQIV